jgi:CheY-like chemotaxis protein
VAKVILIADDDASVRKAIRGRLERAGYICFEAVDGLDAVEQAAIILPDLAVLDVRMPNLNGIEVASLLKKRIPQIRSILMTMYDVGQTLISTVGVSAVIVKPEGVSKLAECVGQLLAPPPGRGAAGVRAV